MSCSVAAKPVQAAPYNFLKVSQCDILNVSVFGWNDILWLGLIGYCMDWIYFYGVR